MNRIYHAQSLVIVAIGLLALSLPVDRAHPAVGRTEAAYGVTPNGGVSYNIPIRVTDGINGMTPSLAITYAGPGARTILGVGFGLSGISYITPCRKTIAQDLNAAPVTLTSTDRYCLDGARLRLVSGTYGATSATYRTELDQLVRVTSLNSTSNIPGWFKVEMPNGLEYEYGNSTDSKLLASGTSGAPPQFWAVNRISDPNGNSIVFVYDTDSNSQKFRPSYIDYTVRGSSGSYRIAFVYQSATQPEPTLDFTPSQAGGAAHIENRLLERVDLSHDGSVYRKVELTYETAAGSGKRLQSVQECVPGSPDDCLPPTELTWQDATPGFSSPITNGAVVSSVLTLDMNGDGIEDLIWPASGTWRYMLGSATGFGSVVNTGVTVKNASKAMPLQWNGDGRWDLLIDWTDNKWRVLTGTSSGISTSPVHAGPGSGIPSNTANTSWTVADANGDGRDDLLSMPLNTDMTIYLRLNGTTGFGASSMVYSDGNVHTLSKGFINAEGRSAIERPDFNGDGRVDLLIYGCIWEPEPPGWCIVTRWFQLMSEGSTYVNQGMLQSASSNINLRYADFNSDGLTDIIYPALTPGKWYYAYGYGNGAMWPGEGPNLAGYSLSNTLTGDYDGDGYDDFLVATSSSPQWHVYRGSGAGLATSAIVPGISIAHGGWILRDQNGDSLPDLGAYAQTTQVWNTYVHQGVPGDRLTSATDGLGNSASFSYLPMTDNTVYAKGTGAVFPSQDVEFSTPLVRTMQIAPAGGDPYTMTYKYKDARVHAQGRSFLGMGTREITDSRNSVFTAETFRQDFPYIGAPSTVTVKQSSAGNTIQLVTHTYSHHVLNSTSGNERYLPYRSKTVTKAHEVGGYKNGLQITEITQDHTVNTLGNSTFVSTKVEDKDSGSAELGSIWRTEITSTYTENVTDWCLALPLTRSEKRILPNGTNETRAASWEVSTASCRVTKETIAPGAASNLSLVTDLTYDTCGNVGSISSYPAGQSGQARTTEIGHGTRCQRPETIENPLDQQTSIAYDWKLALPTSRTDPNGISVVLHYDGFGHLARRDNPDGTDVAYSAIACTVGNSWCGKTSIARVRVTRATRNTSDAVIRTDEQFLDGLGRVRWSHADSLESGPPIVATFYDEFGRASSRSQPYLTGGAVYWTNVTYDLIGRLAVQDAAIDEGATSGRITGFAYEGRDLKITDPKGFITTQRSNAIGELRSIVDPSPGGTTSYAYHPFGKIASITDAASNVTTWNYNTRGFLTQTIDPDSGTSIFEPNAFGEMDRMRDAKTSSPNWTVQFTFDKLARPLTRVDLSPSGTTTFTWGSSAASKNIGRLASISSPGSYSETYSFDNLGRLSQQSVVADGMTYYLNLAYGATTGLLDTIEYPTSTSSYRLKVRHEYANGHLKRVRDANGSTVFWEAVSTDAFGHIQDELFGNGVKTVTDFDQASGLMATRQGGIGGGTGLINAEVDWDLNGNLVRRKDFKLSPIVTEDFFYDGLNRFDSSQRNGVTNGDVTLDAIGNITWKLGIGNYTYDATQKRAVVSAGSNIYDYDAAGNMTSRNGSSITYASYNLPTVINAGAGYSSTLSYGAFRNRFKQVAVSGGATETTIYVAGLMERVTRGATTEYRHIIRGSKGAAAIYTRVSGGSNSTYYLHRDHLGSPELITNSVGAALARPSFGAYGERRDGTDWSGAPSAGDLTSLTNITHRGFTGHEHLDAVGLIHMNGRVYEPVIGKFLGVDPLIQIGSSQSPNSYAYVWNNPLTMVDLSGFQATDVTDDGPQPRNLPQCPYEIANIAVDCPYRYGWRWDIDPYELWLMDEYRIQSWVNSRSAQAQQTIAPIAQSDGRSFGGPIVMRGADDGKSQESPSVLEHILSPAEQLLSPILDYFVVDGVENKCGPEGVFSVPNGYGDVSINVPCISHDDCYRSSGETRANCDAAIRRDIIKAFEEQDGNPIVGYIIAQNYWGILRVYGGPAYDAMQSPRRPRMAVPNGFDWSKVQPVRR